MRTERHIFREQKVRVQKKFYREGGAALAGDFWIFERAIVPASWQSWAIHQGCHWWFLRYRWARRRDTNDYGSAFLDVIFLSLTLLVKCWNAIDDDLLFSLDSKEFHISVFWVFTLFADPHLEALFMTLPPKNPQTFFSLHYFWLFDLFEYSSRELGCRFSVELTLWNFLGVAI